MADFIPAALANALRSVAREARLCPDQTAPAVAEAARVVDLRGRHLLQRHGVDHTTTPRQFFIRYAQQRFKMEAI